MHLAPKHWLLLIVNLAYIVPFTVYYVANGQGEFIWYVLVLFLFFGLIVGTLHKSKFPLSILLGLSAWSFLHMAGGSIPVADGVLYAMPIVELFSVGDTYVLKYDQVIHAFGFFVSTLVMHHLLVGQVRPGYNKALLLFAAGCAGMGLGALNEVVEFGVVLTVPDNGVGGYFNTALDLVFNMLGAALAMVMIVLRRK